MGSVKGTVSLLLFPRPRLLGTQRDLCTEERNTEDFINKCSEKASISVSLLFIGIDCYL